jgi:hypothetical protein
MAKARSPQYPAISLKEAVDKVRQVYDSDYQNLLPRPVVAQHMGYQSLNGKSLGVLAALAKYGLLEGRGDNTRVSDLAVTIIAHPPGARERVAALREAATKPELFGELEGRFPGGKASDQAIRSYLLTQKFIPSAADAAIRAYRDTKSFVDGESAGYSDHAAQEQEEEVEQIQQVERQRPVQKSAPLEANEPYRVSVVGGKLKGDFNLSTAAEADEMLAFINAWKGLLKPAAPKRYAPDIEELVGDGGAGNDNGKRE